MKTNKFLGALMCSALLASCSLDEDFEAKSDVAANPKSPVFTVNLPDNEGTRAALQPDGSLGFSSGDQLSLLHGVGELESTKNFKGYQGAIYEGATNGSSFEFSTKSLVYAGYAIMMYPADTKFANDYPGTANPKVSIDLEQDETTKTKAPHVSDVIFVDEYDKTKGEDEQAATAAGYGRKYDIALKRIGAVMPLKLITSGGNLPTGSNLDPVKVNKVEIIAQDGKTPFTKTVTLDADLNNSLDSKTASTSTDAFYKGHTAWKYPVNFTPYAYGNSISTTDIDNTNVATFTLLKALTTIQTVKDAVDADEDNNIQAAEAVTENWVNGLFTAGTAGSDGKKPNTANVTIRVHTNYGYVDLDKSSRTNITENGQQKEVGPWRRDYMDGNTAKTEYKDVLTGLNETMIAAHATATTAFKGEEIGKRVSRSLYVNLSDMIMDEVHIETESDLINMYNVVKALQTKPYKNENGTYRPNVFWLDSKNGAEFRIQTTAGYEAYKYLTQHKENVGTAVVPNMVNIVELKLCTKNEHKTTGKVSKVVFATPVGEEYTLGKDVNDAKDLQLSFGTSTPVQIEGTWNIGEVQAENVSSITIGDGTATLKDVVSAEGVTDGIINNATINTKAEETLVKAKITNYGTINVITGTTLKMSGATLKNDVTIPANFNNGWATDADDEAQEKWKNQRKIEDIDALSRGIINIAAGAMLTNATTTNAEIINVGKIVLTDETSIVQITENQAGTPTLNVWNNITSDHILGIVDCQSNGLSSQSRIGTKTISGSGNNTTITYSNEGIVMTTNPNKVVAGSVVNYLKLTSLPANKELNVKYLDVALTGNNNAGGNYTVDVMIVRSGRIFFDENQTLKADVVYLKGKINYVNDIKSKTTSQTTSYQGYFGGAGNADKANGLESN